MSSLDYTSLVARHMNMTPPYLININVLCSVLRTEEKHNTEANNGGSYNDNNDNNDHPLCPSFTPIQDTNQVEGLSLGNPHCRNCCCNGL